MILDSSLLMDDKAAITVTRPSTNVIDIGKSRDIGVGARKFELLLQVTTALVGPGAATIQAQYQGSTDNATWVTIIESNPGQLANGLSAGTKFLATTVPRQSPASDLIAASMFRYFRINWVVANGPLTAGAVTATMVLDRSDPINYPKNFSAPSA